MAWYDNERSLTHTQTYASAELAAKDAERALVAGWQVETDGPVRNPKFLAPHKWLVPFDTRNRQPGEVELTYVRTPEWLENTSEPESGSGTTRAATSHHCGELWCTRQPFVVRSRGGRAAP